MRGVYVCACMCVCVCVHACVRAWCVCVCWHVCVCLHVWCVCMRACMHVSRHVCMCGVRACVHACMCWELTNTPGSIHEFIQGLLEERKMCVHTCVHVCVHMHVFCLLVFNYYSTKTGTINIVGNKINGQIGRNSLYNTAIQMKTFTLIH